MVLEHPLLEVQFTLLEGCTGLHYAGKELLKINSRTVAFYLCLLLNAILQKITGQLTLSWYQYHTNIVGTIGGVFFTDARESSHGQQCGNLRLPTSMLQKRLPLEVSCNTENAEA